MAETHVRSFFLTIKINTYMSYITVQCTLMQAADVQAELQAYLNSKNINALFIQIVESLLIGNLRLNFDIKLTS